MSAPVSREPEGAYVPDRATGETRWERVTALLEALLERPAGERAALLEAARAGGSADARWVADEAASLLAAHEALERAGGFLDTPAVAALGGAPADDGAAASSLAAPSLDAPSPDADGAPLVGQRLGAYVLEREIGRGGMGAVYQARRADGAFAHEVAIKVIKRGLDTDALVARFRRERQILATLVHPHIARLLDGGAAPDGRPYLVMEHVDGEPLDAHCARRALDARARLALFLDVCAAVHFAHQRLVVHRDLKPANVLVTADGTVKLLDFGLARLIDGDTGDEVAPSTLAGAGLRAMTPEYASPEQVLGAPASTLGDVYSLGVLLYELLAGRRPYGFTHRSPDEIARVVAAHVPAPLAGAGAGAPGLSRADAGELDTIVATAMHKDAARRYASVEQLADDVRRFLERRPLRARRDAWPYRMRRFVQRHRAGVAAGALVVASLVGGAGLALWQAGVARRERAVAEARLTDVRRLAGALVFEVHDAVTPLAGSTPVRELVVRRALAYLDRLARPDARADAPLDPALARELSAAYARIGEIQGNFYVSNLGQTAAAESSYARALALAERALAARPDDAGAQADVAARHLGVGDMDYTLGRLRAAQARYARAESLAVRLATAAPGDTAPRRLLATARVRLADVTGLEGFPNLGDPEGARALYARAVADYEAVLAARPDDDALRATLATVLTHQASAARALGDGAAAIAASARAVAMLEGVTARHPTSGSYRIDLHTAYDALRLTLVADGRLDSALVVGRRALDGFEAARAADPRNAVVVRDLAVSLRGHGRDLLAAGRTRDAMRMQRRSSALTDSLLAADPTSVSRRTDAAFAALTLGEAELAAGDARAALATYRRAVAALAALQAADASNLALADMAGVARGGVGNARVALGDARGGVVDLRASVRMAEAVAARTPTHVGRRNRVARQRVDLGAAHAAAGERVAACAAYGSALAQWRTSTPPSGSARDAYERARRGAASLGCR